MAFFGFLLAFFLFCRLGRELRRQRAVGEDGATYMTWHHGWDAGCGGKWGREWERHEARARRHAERWARHAERHAKKWGWPMPEPPGRDSTKTDAKQLTPEEEALRRARRRAAAEAGF